MSGDINNENISAGRDYAGRDLINYYGAKPTRLEMLFRRLADEVESNQQIKEVIDDIEHYVTLLDGTKGLEEKLQDGGFSPDEIKNATRKKMKYAKKAEKYKFFESAQRIDAFIFGDIKTNFDNCVMPLIESGAAKSEILEALQRFVINPLMDKIECDGACDQNLFYNAEDINGMLFYLTGGCHINWKKYDL